MSTFTIYENERKKVTHAIYTDGHGGAQRLYPYRYDKKSHSWNNVSGNVTKRTLYRDDKRELHEQIYKWA